MKKFFLVIAFSATVAACNNAGESTTVKTDSATAATDTTKAKDSTKSAIDTAAAKKDTSKPK